MARWIKLTEFCFHQRLEFTKTGNLNFQDINSMAMRKLGARRKGFEPVAVKFSLYQALHKFEEYTVEATCTVIVPKRSGMTISVSKEGSPPKKIPGADFYNRVLALKKGTTMKIKTSRSDASFNNLIFLYDIAFVRSKPEPKNKE